MRDECLWLRQAQNRHQLILTPSQRGATLRKAHDDLGHKGFYPTLRIVLDRFWWPTISLDVKQYIATCHECQICQTTKVWIPPTIAIPASLFHKVYIDTMLMPPAAGYHYIVQARCSLSA
jgi:Integrase zinc binding domain